MTTNREEKIARAGIAGALVAGLGAAACCLGPLLFAALGLAGGGLLVAFEPYRPLFIAVAAAALGAGFWYSYRTPKAALAQGSGGAAGEADCDCEMPRANRLGRGMLWVATVVVAAFIASPYLIRWAGAAPAVEGAEGAPGGAGGGPVTLATATIPVKGMSCAGCEVTIRTALEKVPGVIAASADAAAGVATVKYDPEQVGLQKLVEAINRAGYRATLPGRGS